MMRRKTSRNKHAWRGGAWPCLGVKGGWAWCWADAEKRLPPRPSIAVSAQTAQFMKVLCYPASYPSEDGGYHNAALYYLQQKK